MSTTILNMVQAAQQPFMWWMSYQQWVFWLLLGYWVSSLIITCHKIVQWSCLINERDVLPSSCVPSNYGHTKKIVKDLGNDVIHSNVAIKVACFSSMMTQTTMPASFVNVQYGRGKCRNKKIKTYYHMQRCITCQWNLGFGDCMYQEAM